MDTQIDPIEAYTQLMTQGEVAAEEVENVFEQLVKGLVMI
jgi:hypothetical protein